MATSAPASPLTAGDSHAIGRQPSLPLHVAWGVVTQGIRIRLGRSLVTLTSVALGIAFLASILVGQVVQRGVQHENDARDEAIRQSAALEAEIGRLTGKRVWLIGTPDVQEQRLLTIMTAAGAELVTTIDGSAPAATLVVGRAPVPAAATGIVAGSFTSPPAAVDGQKVDGRKMVNFALPATAEQLAARADAAFRASARTAWITSIALAVTAIGITNAMLMSVTERFREIGTMKCLGALGSFIRRVFVLEACLIGTAGGLSGALLGMLASCASYALRYGGNAVLHSTAWGSVGLLMFASVVVSIVLSVAAAVYPAWVAARMLPANALRSSV